MPTLPAVRLLTAAAVAIAASLLSSCHRGGGVVATGPEPTPPPAEALALELHEPSSDVEVATGGVVHVEATVRDRLAAARLRLWLDGDGDHATIDDQHELAAFDADAGETRRAFDLDVPSSVPAGSYRLLGLLDDGQRLPAAAAAAGKVVVATTPDDPGDPGDPPDDELTLELLAPAAELQIARGGAFAVELRAEGGSGSVDVTIVADADGDADTTDDQRELATVSVPAGTAAEILVDANVEPGPHSILAFATGTAGTASATAPGLLQVVDAALATREGSASYEEGRALTFLPDGSTVVAGRFAGSTTFGVWPLVTHLNSAGDDDIFLARYRADGSLAWARRAGGPSRADWPNAIAAAGDGSFVVGGSFHGLAALDGGAPTSGLQSAGDDDAFLARYAASGTLLWAKRAGGVLRDDIHGVAMLPDGSIVATGSFAAQAGFGEGAAAATETVRGSLMSRDGFVARYDAGGALLWVRSFGSSDLDDAGRSVAAAADGSVIVTGVFRGMATFGSGIAETVLVAAGGSDVFVARYDAGGTLLWARRAGGPGDDEARSVAATTGGGAIVAGGHRAEATFPDALQPVAVLSAGGLDAFLAHYAADGSLLWVRSIGGTADDEARAVLGTPDGGCVSAGRFEGTAAVAGGAAGTNLVGTGGRDVFVARHDAGGNLLWVRAAGGTAPDEVFAIAGAANRAFAITGSFQGVAGFGEGARRRLLTAAGWADVFVVRYNADGDL